jgi:hypothetical protein
MADKIKLAIAETFMELSRALHTGKARRRPVIALSGMSSELGEEEVLKGALIADGPDAEVVYIGTIRQEGLRCVSAFSEQEAADTLNAMLDSGEADGAVTMHYPFPIGVATVGRAVSPARGAPFYLASTTGTAAAGRVEAMIRNAVYGAIVAKACGNPAPTIGIANLDGARQAEAGLRQLAKNGYPIRFAESRRADGGCLLRGNDILTGAADVIVADTLTGNIITKMLSAFTTGGDCESTGWGYGPGIGQGYGRLVLIVSRASGAAVIAGAIAYGAQMARSGWKKIAAEEFALANQAGLDRIAEKKGAAAPPAQAQAPPKEVATAEISGIDVMDIDVAVHALWRQGIYAEGGMGCTGPVVLVAESKRAAARMILTEGGLLSES